MKHHYTVMRRLLWNSGIR